MMKLSVHSWDLMNMMRLREIVHIYRMNFVHYYEIVGTSKELRKRFKHDIESNKAQIHIYEKVCLFNLSNTKHSFPTVHGSIRDRP